MKQLRRILWNLLAACSGLLCVATMVWWIAGANNQVTLRPYADQDSWALTLTSSLGRCAVQYGPTGPTVYSTGRVEFSTTFDLWKAVVALAVLPGIWLGLFFQRKLEAKRSPPRVPKSALAAKSSVLVQSNSPTRAVVTSTLLVLILLFWLITTISNRDFGFAAGPFNFAPQNGTLFLRYFQDREAVRGKYVGTYGFVFFGLKAYRMKYVHTSRYTLVLPDWGIAAVLSIILWRQLRLWRQARRIRLRIAAGRCSACGYDLKNNVSNVCPECGNKMSDDA
jgi:hypothetical protein